MAQLKKGDKAPDFSLTDQQGTTVKLSDYKGKNCLFIFIPRQIHPDVPNRHAVSVTRCSTSIASK